MELSHFTHHQSMRASMVGFSEMCRQNGLSIGLSHTQEGVKTAQLGFIRDPQSFYYGLKSLFCKDLEEEVIFDHCFKVYWKKRKHKYAHKIQQQGKSNVTKNTKASLVMMGLKDDKNKEKPPLEEAKSVSGVSHVDQLKHTDFSKIKAVDLDQLDDLIEKLLKQLNTRLKRRLTHAHKGKIDIRKSIRKNISSRDEIINLSYQKRKIQKTKLVILLDVSGSMDKYSFFLLKFVWSLKSHLKNIEAFIFSTQLIRITDLLKEDELTESMMQMSEHATNWSGGTKIGDCLSSFNNQFAKQVLNGRSVTIILSDGLDDGDPQVMFDEVHKIKLRTRKLVWLNPLKGMKGYEPLAKGMKAALPAVDDFRSAHNLDSLMELENILSHA
jgi:uncharacterized protein with von Willebrand factor type A (vWA) domain